MKSCALIFVNWKTPELTIQAMASACESVATDEALRFIVVDNGSGDGSVARIRAVYPEATCVEFNENRGFAAAANAGLAEVDEDYAIVCNTDILFHQNAITRLVEALETDDRATLACPRLLREDGSSQAAAVPEPAIFWELVNRSLPRRFITLHPDRPTPVPTVVGPCMALHMERLKTVGGFDESFFFFFEETDLCRRINRSEHHCLYVPGASVVHFQGKTANQRPIHARIEFFKSRYIYFKKHTGRTGLTILAAGLFLKILINTLFYTLLGLGSRRFRDKSAVCRNLLLWHLKGCPPQSGLQRKST